MSTNEQTKTALKNLDRYKSKIKIGDRAKYYPVVTNKTIYREVTISSEPFITCGGRDIGIFVKEVSGYVVIEAIEVIK